MNEFIRTATNNAYKKLSKQDILNSLYSRNSANPVMDGIYTDDAGKLCDYTITYKEVWEECLGIFLPEKRVTDDNGEPVDLANIQSASCVLVRATYFQQPEKDRDSSVIRTSIAESTPERSK